MNRSDFSKKVGLCSAALFFIAVPAMLRAQTDEIQVYDAEIEDHHKISLELHNNFTFEGRKTADFPGGVISNHAYVGVAEWAYGVLPWFEQGLYLPLYSYTPAQGLTYNGFKIRELFVKPKAAEQNFFYGVNFEFSVNQKQWNPRRYSSEVRGIFGWHIRPTGDAKWKQIDVIIDPIVDTDYTGGVKSLELVPSERVAYNLNKTWQLAMEHYSDYGQLRNIVPVSQQFHQVWAVVDRASEKWVHVEAGIGFGLTGGSDKITLKLMLERDLN